MRKMGQEPDPSQLEQMEAATAAKLNAGSTAIFGTARLWDDGLIDPRDTRELLANLLDICRQTTDTSKIIHLVSHVFNPVS